MSNRTGRLLVVDIGSEETKLMDVTVSGGIILHNIERMRDMSPFVSGGKLINFEQFVLSLKDTLKSKGIRTKRLLLTSSILGMESEIIKLPNGSEKDIETSFKTRNGAVKPDLTRVDYQVYNAYTTETDSNVYCVQALSSNYTVASLTKLLEAAGFTIVDVVDPMSSLLNLIKLYPSSYDIQSRLIVLAGHSTTAFPILRDTPMDSLKISVTFYSIIEALRQSFQLSELKIRKLLNVVGIKRDPTLQKELIDADVDLDTYYGILDECIQDFKTRVAKTIKDENAIGNYGIFSVLLCGGFVDMPGLLEVLQDGSTVTYETVPESMTRYSNISIKNKTHENLTSAYDICMGAVLGKYFKRRISLRPKYSSAKVPVEVAEKLCILATVGVCAFTAFSGYNLYNNMTELTRLENVKQETMKMQTQYSQSERKLTEQKTYLEALNTVDFLMQPLINYINSKQSSTFVIASVDSQNMLIDAKLNETGATEFLDAASADAAANSETAASAEGEFITEGTAITATKSPLVVRGYAIASEDITEFYKGLISLEFAKDVKMKGIAAKTLPSDEGMYIFEIQIER